MNAMTPNPIQPVQSTPPKNPPAWSVARSVEEPSFIDLLVMLLQHKWVIVTCSVVGACAGIALVLLLPRNYAYSTMIELGTAQQDVRVPIEAPEAVVTKLTNSFLPAIERNHGAAVGVPAFTLDMDVKNPRGTNLVLLTSKGTAANQDEHLKLHRQLAERLLEEHRREFQLLRSNLDFELEKARRAAAAAKDQATTLAVRRTLLLEKRSLANQRLQEIDGELAHIVASRDAASKTQSHKDQALTMMMLDLQLARERDKRDELQRQLALGLTEETDRLAHDESDLKRALQDHDDRIATIQLRIAHVAETRLIGEPQRSQKPVGMGRAVTIGMGLCLGLMIGVMTAFMRQSLSSRASGKDLGYAPA